MSNVKAHFSIRFDFTLFYNTRNTHFTHLFKTCIAQEYGLRTKCQTFVRFITIPQCSILHGRNLLTEWELITTQHFAYREKERERESIMSLSLSLLFDFLWTSNFSVLWDQYGVSILLLGLSFLCLTICCRICTTFTLHISDGTFTSTAQYIYNIVAHIALCRSFERFFKI